MPWTLDDYPSSLKNLPHVEKKKAIDIANALVDEGYDEGRAIPIATEQAKEWYRNATEKERKQYEKDGDPQKRDEKYHSRPELLDKDVLILPQDGEWAVQTKTAKKPSKIFSKKDEAVDYGKSIAKNKQTKLHIYKLDETVERTINYENTTS